MTKATCVVNQMVRICIGEEKGRVTQGTSLIDDLVHFQEDENIMEWNGTRRCALSETSFMRFFTGYFTPEDAKKIKTWLLEHGIECKEQAGVEKEGKWCLMYSHKRETSNGFDEVHIEQEVIPLDAITEGGAVSEAKEKWDAFINLKEIEGVARDTFGPIIVYAIPFQ